MKNEKIREVFKDYNLSEYQANQFNLFYAKLVEENQKYNLTTITQEDGVLLKHFLDSVLPVKELSDNSLILDIGSGAGFPSIPLAIMNSSFRITAIDAVQKKVNFINMVTKDLQISNIIALHSRAEDFIKNNRNAFDFVVSRAVASLPTLLEYSIPFLKTGGIMVAYKSGKIDEELELSKKALEIFNCKIVKILDFSYQGNDRKIVLIKKIYETPLKYPRGMNKPRLNPIV